MTIQIHRKGSRAGNVSIYDTILTMERGEVWRLKPVLYCLQYVRNVCSRANRSTDRVYTVGKPRIGSPFIEVRRIH